MVDQISNPAAAAKAYSNMAKGADAPGLEASGKTSFGDVLKDTAVKTMQTMRSGETASAKAVAGNASLPEVVQAITAAELTLQTVVAVRDRMMSAYQEVMRMPI
ncbi:MAG: flagellar hook-basal body complex protein FliE [Micavibrio sp.]|nr:flagellar hook-basal body complex protein FliE [Micavibrio sp.]|tara:strand:- start:763 stop:1074 length:312 start_codon:yes stop_codon:yes gene_type:complete